MGRKDWFILAMGALFGRIHVCIAPPDEALAAFVRHLVSSLFDEGGG